LPARWAVRMRQRLTGTRPARQRQTADQARLLRRAGGLQRNSSAPPPGEWTNGGQGRSPIFDPVKRVHCLTICSVRPVSKALEYRPSFGKGPAVSLNPRIWQPGAKREPRGIQPAGASVLPHLSDHVFEQQRLR
jgi:hypothetical protein